MKALRRILMALLILVTLGLSVSAADLVWTMKPQKMSLAIRMTEYEYLDNFGFLVEENNRYKLIDKSGKAIMDFPYASDYKVLNEDCLIVYKSGKYGVIDKTGKELIPTDKYDVLKRVDDDLLVAGICQNPGGYILNYKYGLVDKNGKEIIGFNYEELAPINEELISAKKDGKYGVINKSGKTVLSFKYGDTFNLINENYMVSTPFSGDTPSVITDLKGKVLLSDKNVKYVYGDFDGNFRVVYRDPSSPYAIGEIKILNAKMKTVDTKGLTISPLNSTSLIAVNSSGKSGIVDKTFKTVVAFDYDVLTRIDDELIWAMKGSESIYINSKGERLSAFDGYKSVSFLTDGYYIIGKAFEGGFYDETVYGIADKNGNVVLNPEYASVRYIGKGVIALETRSRRMGIAAFGEGERVADYIDGLVLTIDKNEAKVFGADARTDVTPIIRNGSTMLPARFVAENLGAKVDWDNDKRQVIITPADPGAGIIVLTIDSKEARYGMYGVYETLNMAPFIEQGRTYTPVRFIAEKLGYRVFWENATRTVKIIK